MHDAPSAEHTIDGGMKFGGHSSRVGMSGGPTEPTALSTDTEEPFLVGASSAVAVQAVAAAKGSGLGDGGSSVQMSQRRRNRLARIRTRAFWAWLLKTKQKKMQQAVRRMSYQALSTRVAAG
jgi:hypothetical protein